ncbi:toll/interleukin-1 receptor domain-containing protein [Bacillus sp. JJ1609]|uniref:toll/interleukin-1 receptor domain-containing protein n=1 Tax=Bacillus sp. JJ1609 TaxID=3122977 RepID=UPI003000ADB3
MSFDVFLSHQGVDTNEVKQLADFMEPEIVCWYAPERILGSTHFGPELNTGIEESKVILVYLTENFEKKLGNYVRNEVIYARKKEKLILPVLKGREDYPRELEMHLNASQWFKIDDYETVEEAWRQLRSLLQVLLKDAGDGMNAAEFLSHSRNRANRIPDGFSQVSENLLSKHKHVFTPSFDFNQLKVENPIRVFYGIDLAEKTSHAINFLSGKNKKILFEGLGIDSLKTLAAEPLHEDSGYFIHIDRSELGKFVSESFLENLSLRLNNARAELVLCTDGPVPNLESSEVLLPLDKKSYILNHLSWNIQDPEKIQIAEKILSKDNELIHNINQSDVLLELVSQLSSIVNGEQSVEQFAETVRFLTLERAALPFDLEREDNINDILYSLAIALNHGRSYERIIESYDYLLTEFQKTYPAQQINYHTRSFSTLKRDFNLKVVDKRVSNHLGNYAEECVYYQYEVMADKIWPAVWSEYPYRDYLAGVLIGHLGSKYSFIVSRVEDIMFSIIDSRFEQGVERLITPLAKSDNMAENLLAKRLLIRLYNDTKYKLKTVRLLKNWISIRNKRLERTAMLTIQSEIGIENYQMVLEWLLDLLVRNGKPSNTLYFTLSYFSKYVYLSPELEKLFYGTLKDRLAEWREEEVYLDYLKLLAKIFRNHPPLFYKTQSSFVESFLFFVLVILVEQEHLEDAAVTLARLLAEYLTYPDGKEHYQSLLKKLHAKLSAVQFHNLIETVKKGDENVISI